MYARAMSRGKLSAAVEQIKQSHFTEIELIQQFYSALPS